MLHLFGFRGLSFYLELTGGRRLMMCERACVFFCIFFLFFFSKNGILFLFYFTFFFYSDTHATTYVLMYLDTRNIHTLHMILCANITPGALIFFFFPFDRYSRYILGGIHRMDILVNRYDM